MSLSEYNPFQNCTSVWETAKTFASFATADLMNSLTKQILPTRTLSVKNSLTSCIHTMIALGKLFHGDESNKVIKAVLEECTSIIPIHINSKKLTVKINSALFSSALSLSALKMSTSDSNDYDTICQENSTLMHSLFTQHVNSSPFKYLNLNPDSFVSAYKTKKFDFNQISYDSLSKDLATTEKQLTQKIDFIYYLTLVNPMGKGFLHGFVIHQYLGEDKEPLYQIFQSMVTTYTLKESMESLEQKGIGSKGLDKKQFTEFLKNLKVVVCNQSQGTTDITRWTNAFERCFQLKPSPIPDMNIVGKSDSSEVTIADVSLRYQFLQCDTTKLAEQSFKNIFHEF